MVWLLQLQITLDRFENSLCHVITKLYRTGQEKAFNLSMQMWSEGTAVLHVPHVNSSVIDSIPL